MTRKIIKHGKVIEVREDDKKVEARSDGFKTWVRVHPEVFKDKEDKER